MLREEEIKDLLNKNEDEFMKFERIENPKSKRADMHAFMLLDEILDHRKPMIMDAQHDVICLALLSELKNATKEQIIDLVRCGVHYNSESDSLAMFV